MGSESCDERFLEVNGNVSHVFVRTLSVEIHGLGLLQ